MDDHRYYGVNVKVPFMRDTDDEAKLREIVGDDGVQALFDGLTEEYWLSLNEQAQEEFGVYSEGRTGGWAVPNPHIDPEEGSERFEKFRALAQGERDYYVETLWPERVSERLAEIAAEKVNRAEAEARDIVTR